MTTPGYPSRAPRDLPRTPARFLTHTHSFFPHAGGWGHHAEQARAATPALDIASLPRKSKTPRRKKTLRREKRVTAGVMGACAPPWRPGPPLQTRLRSPDPYTPREKEGRGLGLVPMAVEQAPPGSTREATT